MSHLVEVFHGRGGPAQRELYEVMLREAGIPFIVKSDTGSLRTRHRRPYGGLLLAAASKP